MNSSKELARNTPCFNYNAALTWNRINKLLAAISLTITTSCQQIPKTQIQYASTAQINHCYDAVTGKKLFSQITTNQQIFKVNIKNTSLNIKCFILKI